MFDRYVLIVCLMVYGIILQYAHSCLDIYSKTTSRLEENIDMILCVPLTHTTNSTLQQVMTMQYMVVTGLWQVLRQHRPLHPLVLHCTLLTNGFNAFESSYYTIVKIYNDKIREAFKTNTLAIPKNSFITTKSVSDWNQGSMMLLLLFVLGLQSGKACPNYEAVWDQKGLLL